MHGPQAQTANMADALAGTLRVARALVEEGRPVDLAGLQEAVGRLCAATLDLPDPQGRAVRPKLDALLAELAALEAALRTAGHDATA